jgi:uncharacterized protein (TIGR00255 family)
MRSMTGYAYKELIKDGITVSVEIKGYNSRFLDLYIYLPQWLSSLEPGLREYISSRFSRGKIEIGIRLKEEDAPVSVTINENAAKMYLNAINGLIKNLSLNKEFSLDMLLGLEGVLAIETERDIDKYRDKINTVVAAASDQFEAERMREGKHTLEDINTHIEILENSLQKISVYVPEIEINIKENLRKRFVELIGDRIDENRILAETAVLLMKYTISEELSRLSSHLSEFRLETEKSSSGKKLDFISQEINREINTIGSKTPLIDVSKVVVEMKNALENIREQLRNVE